MSAKKIAELEQKVDTLLDSLALEDRARLQLWDRYCRLEKNLKTVTDKSAKRIAELEQKIDSLNDQLALEDQAQLRLWDDFCRLEKNFKAVTTYATRTAAERDRLREENKKLRELLNQK